MTTLLLVYACTGGAVSALVAAEAATIPDRVEMAVGVVPHRTVTHWLWIYLLPLVGVSFVMFHSMLLYLVFFVFVGCFLHVFEDFLSRGGIPVKGPFSSPVGANFYVTGTVSEVITSLLIVCAALVVAWGRGFLDPEYLASQPASVGQFIKLALQEVF